jgi:hypothetical protein
MTNLTRRHNMTIFNKMWYDKNITQITATVLGLEVGIA